MPQRRGHHSARAKNIDFCLYLVNDPEMEWFRDCESAFTKWGFEATLIPKHNLKTQGWTFELTGIYPTSPVRGSMPERYRAEGFGNKDLLARKRRRKMFVEQSILQIAADMKASPASVYIVGSKLAVLPIDE